MITTQLYQLQLHIDKYGKDIITPQCPLCCSLFQRCMNDVTYYQQLHTNPFRKISVNICSILAASRLHFAGFSEPRSNCSWCCTLVANLQCNTNIIS